MYNLIKGDRRWLQGPSTFPFHNICQRTTSNIRKSILSTTTIVEKASYCPPSSSTSSNKWKTIDKCCSGYRIYDEAKVEWEQVKSSELENTQNWPKKQQYTSGRSINVKRGCHRQKELRIWWFNICEAILWEKTIKLHNFLALKPNR